MKLQLNTFFLIFFTIVCTAQIGISQTLQPQAEGLLPNDYGIFSISTVDENIVWAVAFNHEFFEEKDTTHVPKLMKTIDGGKNWTVTDIIGFKGRICHDVFAFDVNTAFITTHDYGNGAGIGLIKTTDGGATWTENYSSINGGVWVRFFNENDGVVVNRRGVSTTSDGGESWVEVDTSNIPEFQAQEFTLLSSGNNSCVIQGDNIWFGTTRDRVYRSNDKGKTWQVSEVGLGKTGILKSVAFKDEMNGLTTTGYTFLRNMGRTKDGGETWEGFSANPALQVSNLTYIPDTDGGFLATSDQSVPANFRSVAYTTDFGKHWTKLDAKGSFSSASFVNKKVGWVARYKVTDFFNVPIYKWEGDAFVGTEDYGLNEKITVSPNPFEHNLNVELNDLGKVDYKIYTVDGVLVGDGVIRSGRQSIDLKVLLSGTYFLELTNGNHFTTKKIIKK